jgi:hypothetical protein
VTGANGTDRHAAVAAWQEAAARGTQLTGAELARRFGRSDRWGRQVVADARRSARSGVTTGDDQQASALTPGGTPSGTHPTPAMPGGDAAAGAGTPMPARRTWQDSAITLVVALVAAAASYGHLLDVALMAGEPVWIARLFPVTVDGLVLAALRRGGAGRRWLALGVAVSVAANVLAQFPDVAATAGPVVSAWPPLALYGTHRLLYRPPDHEHAT